MTGHGDASTRSAEWVTAIFRTDGGDEQHRSGGADLHAAGRGGTAAVVPAHRVRQRRRPRARHRRRAGVGQRRPRLVRVVLADGPVDPDRRARRDPGPADLGEQRPDDVLLPRRRAGGTARDRPRRPARPAPAGAAVRGRHGRDAPARAHLSRGEHGRRRLPRLGRGDVDRHRARPRRARPARPAGAGPDPDLPAHHVRGRRPGLAGRHRGRLQRAGGTAADPASPRSCWPAWSACSRSG